MSTLAIMGGLIDLPTGTVSRAVDQRATVARDPERRVIHLTSDSPFVVNLDGATISVLEIETDGSKVDAVITTADGTAQVVPVDPYMILFSRTAPITALSLIRVSGQDTTVGIVLGPKT